MTILKYLTLTLFIPTLTLSMEPIADTSPASREMNIHVLPSSLVPPQITYYDYVMTLCVGNEIGGWSNASGGFGSWLQSKKNAELLTNISTNEIILDLPFFIETHIPVIEAPEEKSTSAMPQLRIDYGMPIPNSDESKGKPTFFLYRVMTDDDCSNVKLLLKNEKEPEEAFLERQKQWQDKHGRLAHREMKIEAKKASPSIERLFNEPSDAETARSIQEIDERLRRLVSGGPMGFNDFVYGGLMTQLSHIGSSASVHGSSFSSSSGISVCAQNIASASSVGWNNTNNSPRRNESHREHALRNPAGFVLSKDRFGRSLLLEGCYLGDDGIAAIAPHLYQMTSQVKLLNLERNDMTAQGIRALVPFLLQFINLEQLLLNGNPIGDEGLGILGPYLTQLPKLKTLFLWEDNHITDSGIIAIIPYLPARISLSSIGNFLGNEGRIKLREAGFGACGNDWCRPTPEVRNNHGNSIGIPIISVQYWF